LEAATTGRRLPSKEELLDFQARWMRPAGISAILGALLIAASLPLQPSAGGDNDAERLTKFHDQSTELIVGQGILIGIAILLFIPLLYVLIRSVVGRTERVRRGMVALAFVGPVLFAVSGFLVASGLSDVADQFVEQAPAKEQQARERAQSPPQSGKATTTPQATTTSPQTTTTPTPEQAANTARDDLADDLIDDSGLLQAGSLLRFIGLITFVFALIYIPLWAMRTGLLTRFWAMLGLALGVSLLLVPVGIFGLVLWFAAVGLMLARWWPGALPPAWDAGVAVPWPGRDQDIAAPPEQRDGSRTVEGSGREVLVV
jgi:MFS family permease